jgi:hypothetical protein
MLVDASLFVILILMSATKIINVLKNDSFEDVFDVFKNADAEEVILIFPKGSKFAKQGQYFEAIKTEADASDKKVSVMTSDLAVLKFASDAGLSLLEQPARNIKKAQTVSAPKAVAKPSVKLATRNNEPPDELEHVVYSPVVAQRELRKELEALPITRVEAMEPEIETAVAEEWTEDTPYQNDEVMLAAARAIREQSANFGKPIRDIFTSEAERPVKIKEEKSRPVQVDISRNQMEDEKLDDITKVWAETERRNTKNFSFVPKTALKAKSLKRTSMFLLGGVIIVVGIILYGSLGNAKITIKPKKANLNFTMKVSASISSTAVDNELSRIPGQRFSDKEEVSDTFPATGQKNVVQKAGGKIIIYNKSVSSQRLVATTRFKTPDGVIFRIPVTITVPGAVKAGSVLQEGSIESVVYADRPGAESNIAASTFTIPGFEGTPKTNDFYAKSDKPMTGGMIGLSKSITEEDYAKAQEALTAKLKDKILKAVKSQSGELRTLDSSPIKYAPPTTNAKAGDGAENLQMTISGSADIIAFRESDVKSLVTNYVEKTGDSQLLEKGLTITYMNPQLNADGSAITFDLQITGQAAAKLDTNKIMSDISGMTENTIRTYLGSTKGVDSAHVQLSPFWVRSIPRDSQKIKIVIDQG